MKSICILFIASLLSSTAFLVLGFVLVGNWTGALAVIALGALWMYSHERLAWVTTLASILMIAAGALCLLLKAPGIWVGLEAIAVLSAWDLDRFWWRMRDVKAVNAEGLVNRHLRLLGLTDGMSLVVLILSQTVQLQLSFAVIFFLALIAVFCFSMALRWMKAEKPGSEAQPPRPE